MRVRILTLWLTFLLMPLLASESINPWQELFTEPVEKIHVIMKDKVVFRFTSQYENMVHLNAPGIKKELKKYNYKIKDIEIVIHNHFTDCKFSTADHRQYRVLKRHGFNGHFLLYCHRTNKTYDIEIESPLVI